MHTTPALHMILKSLILLLALADSVLAETPEPPPCVIIISDHCLVDITTSLLNSTNNQLIETQTAIARIAIELNLSQRDLQRTWPYQYKEHIKRAHQSAFKESAAHKVWSSVQILAKKYSTTKTKNRANAYRQDISYEQCMELPTQTALFLKELFCNSLNINHNPVQSLQSKNLKKHTREEQIALLLVTHKSLIENADIEIAHTLIETIILTIAILPIEEQIDIKHTIVEHYLGFGFHEQAINTLDRFTPDINRALRQTPKRQFFKKWAQVMQTARTLPMETTATLPSSTDTVKTLLVGEHHQKLLKDIDTLPLQYQLKFHRLLAQGFFQSFFNTSPAHDLVFAYHLEQWSSLWQTAPPDLKLAEGLTMIQLELRVRSLINHHKKLIKRRR